MKDCRGGAGHEKISMKQEAEQEIIKSSVFLDEQKNRAVVKLAFIADPVENLKIAHLVDDTVVWGRNETQKINGHVDVFVLFDGYNGAFY